MFSNAKQTVKRLAKENHPPVPPRRIPPTMKSPIFSMSQQDLLNSLSIQPENKSIGNARLSNSVSDNQIGGMSNKKSHITGALRPMTPDEFEKTKQELIDRISTKLDVLKEEEEFIVDDMNNIDLIGDELIAKIQCLSVAGNYDKKFIEHISDVERITKLSLSLEVQMKKLNKKLATIPEQTDETVGYRRQHLSRKQDDAIHLEQSIATRGNKLLNDLRKHGFTDNDIETIRNFFSMKRRYIADAHALNDKIQLGEEQLVNLRQSSMFPFYSDTAGRISGSDSPSSFTSFSKEGTPTVASVTTDL